MGLILNFTAVKSLGVSGYESHDDGATSSTQGNDGVGRTVRSLECSRQALAVTGEVVAAEVGRSDQVVVRAGGKGAWGEKFPQKPLESQEPSRSSLAQHFIGQSGLIFTIH